jgi:hypothetical protein
MIQILKKLYDFDFALWTEDTVTKLQSEDFHNLDIENLIEEIESLGRSEKHELRSRLETLLEHILKRSYVNMPECDRGWEITIDRNRNELLELLEQSPSLRRYFMEIFDKAFKFALKIVSKEYPDTHFPDKWIFKQDLNALLNEVFW